MMELIEVYGAAPGAGVAETGYRELLLHFPYAILGLCQATFAQALLGHDTPTRHRAYVWWLEYLGFVGKLAAM